MVTYAIHALEGTFLSPNFRIYQMSYAHLRNFANNVSFKVAQFLERERYPSVMIPSTYPVDMVEKKGLRGDFSHKHPAEIAGLGEIGLINILVTKEFGPRVWLGSVITTAPLLEDPVVRKKHERICIDGCDLCEAACPVGAISKEGTDLEKKTGFKNYSIKNILHWLRKQGKSTSERKEGLRGEEYGLGKSRTLYFEA